MLDDLKYTTKLGELLIPGQKYSVKIAESRDDIEQALKLRFDVFNIELGEGLSESYATQMDEDEYDVQCHHLVVVKNDTNEVIGTYRMQDNIMASAGNGFYTQSYFDIRSMPSTVLNNVVELGRACIHRDHRSGRVLYMLWRGLARYLQLSKKRFLFGCCSLTSQNPAEGAAVYQYLKMNNYLHDEFSIPVNPQHECLAFSRDYTFEDEMNIPQLFRLYLDLGTRVCSKPAIDRAFKTIDYLILLDIDSLSAQSRSLFFR